MTTTDLPRTASLGAVDILVDGLRALGQDRDRAAVVRLTAAAAMASLPQVSGTSLTTLDQSGAPSTVASTCETTSSLTSLQYDHGGPATEVLFGRRSVVQSVNLQSEVAWPAFTKAAIARTSVLSTASFRLFVGGPEAESMGCLNLFAERSHAFDDDALAAGERLAAYVAVALSDAGERARADNLQQALISSRDIGAAIGIIMTRHLITRDAAFQLLNTTSQRDNRKVRDIAEQVIECGDLP